MKKIRNCIGNETFIFAETIEPEAFEQIKKLCDYEPYQKARIRVMPDVHVGKGCTIGMTMVVTDKITPNLVGVDIGCGVLTVKLANREIDFEKLDRVIRSKIPNGSDVHEKPRKEFDFTRLRCRNSVDLAKAQLSIGTLGGGNHFIEVGQSQQSGDNYLIIHSGSRKLGGEVCRYYQEKAYRNLFEDTGVKEAIIEHLKSKGRKREIEAELKRHKMPLVDKELAFLTGSDFNDYMNDMAIVQRFASLNRKTMAEIILEEMGLTESRHFETVHNYIDFKRMILRKGAVSAEKGELLLIPINMCDGSLLCRGKGNEEWNYSAPHGAGRLMSRSKAKETISMDEYISLMKDVYSTCVVRRTLDEAPQAYKSIDEIRSVIVDTVEILTVIKPLYNFKAH
ncbi:RtcB family protein [Bacteroides sedimenti]|uniref:3'-phosphate/5'-hydroxy nucleic acid ligase n=1 Tax=Bacteroides sedimenti TaxID=2136147 RepID=A0ABM8IJ96_9BACE